MDNVRRQIAEIPTIVSNVVKYQNAMKNSDKQNARLEIEDALKFVLFGMMVDDMVLFKQFNDIPSFQKCPADKVFSVTYNT